MLNSFSCNWKNSWFHIHASTNSGYNVQHPHLRPVGSTMGRHPTSTIKYPISNIKHPPREARWVNIPLDLTPACQQADPLLARRGGKVRCSAIIRYRISTIEHPTSKIQHPTSNIKHPPREARLVNIPLDLTPACQQADPLLARRGGKVRCSAIIRYRISTIEHPTSNI